MGKSKTTATPSVSGILDFHCLVWRMAPRSSRSVSTRLWLVATGECSSHGAAAAHSGLAGGWELQVSRGRSMEGKHSSKASQGSRADHALQHSSTAALRLALCAHSLSRTASSFAHLSHTQSPTPSPTTPPPFCNHTSSTSLLAPSWACPLTHTASCLQDS
jgi:hypothetical protein